MYACVFKRRSLDTRAYNVVRLLLCRFPPNRARRPNVTRRRPDSNVFFLFPSPSPAYTRERYESDRCACVYRTVVTSCLRFWFYFAYIPYDFAAYLSSISSHLQDGVAAVPGVRFYEAPPRVKKRVINGLYK